MSVTILTGDCRDVLPTLEAGSFDSCVTDPPYGLSFMGKEWDHGVPGEPFWREVLRVLKPGAHLLAFGGTRTFHRLTCAIEDAGLEIRDCIMWVYGSGFPKSLDVSKAIDREAGAENVIGSKPDRWTGKGGALNFATDRPQAECKITAPATDAARQWSGWGTAMKPAWEPIIVARKPLAGTVAANVQQYGTGAINVDGCRVEYESTPNPATNPLYRKRAGYANSNASDAGSNSYRLKDGSGERNPSLLGRWPANLIHDGSEEVVALFPESDGQIGGNNDPNGSMGYHGGARGISAPGVKDTGSAARFFYCAKASREDREEGCERLSMRSAGEATGGREEGSAGLNSPRAGASRGNGARNHHPTVKPTDLMRYLCRLVTPPGGHVLDPFCGSGSTLKAAHQEGFRATGIELSEEYAAIAHARATTGTMGLAL